MFYEATAKVEQFFTVFLIVDNLCKATEVQIVLNSVNFFESKWVRIQVNEKLSESDPRRVTSISVGLEYWYAELPSTQRGR